MANDLPQQPSSTIKTGLQPQTARCLFIVVKGKHPYYDGLNQKLGYK